MELVETEPVEQKTALAEPEPRYRTAEVPVEKTENGHAWLRILAGVLLAIILIILIVLLARWIYHKAHDNSQPAPATSQKSPASSSNNSTQSGTQSANNSGSGSSSSSSNGSSSNSSSSSSSSTSSGSSASGLHPSSNPSQVSNTGPGNVAAIFVGTSLAVAGLHYLISVRRFARNP